MDKIAPPQSLRRTKISVLSTALTALAFATLASACGALVNDWSDHPIAPIESYSITRNAGDSARDLLSDQYFKSLVVEILVVPGYAPRQEALNQLQTFLSSHLKKPGGISLVMGHELPPSPSGRYSVSDIREIEANYRRRHPQVDQHAVTILFMDGSSVDDDASRKLLGQAHFNSSIVIYEKTLLEQAANTGTPAWKLEATIMMHEFGHLLGLDHCPDSACLMNATIETGNASSGNDDALPALDSSCQQRLNAKLGQ